MRDFGRISTGIWNSRKFQSLQSDDAKLLYFYLHTCPSVNSVGCFVLKPGYAAADLGWQIERYHRAIEALSIALLIGFDEGECLIRISDFLKHSPFSNKNHAAGAIKLASAIPDCSEKRNLFSDIMQQKFIENPPKTADLAIGLSIGLSHGYRTTETETETETEKERESANALLALRSENKENKVSGEKAENSGEVDDAVSIYNAAALRSGWPEAQRISKTRTASIKARMKDAGGIEGWQAAIERAERSDFLCGRTSAGFFASLDFILQASSFTKIMEGNYDTRNPPKNGSHPGTGGAMGNLMAGFAAVAARERSRSQ